MGLLKKLFRGKKKEKLEGGPIANPSFPSATTASESRSVRRGKGSSPTASTSTNNSSNLIQNNNATNYRYNSNSPNPMGDLISPRSTGPVDTDDEGIIIPKETENMEEYYARARNQTQEELRLAYERSQAQNRKTQSISSDDRLTNASSSVEYDDSLTSASPKLTSSQLQQWDRTSNDHPYQPRPSSPIGGGSAPASQQPQHQPSSPPITTQSQRVYTMTSVLPNQQRKFTADESVQSESDASSFNLSTDAEDSEYEYVKRSTMRNQPGNLNGLALGLSALDTSAIDTVGSITSYTTDQDSRIFPNLPTDDEMTLGTEASSKTGLPVVPSLLLQPLPNPMQGNRLVPDPDDTMDSNQAANVSSSTANNFSVNTSNDSSIIPSNVAPKNVLNPSWKNFASDPAKQPSTTKSTGNISRNKPGSTPRNFTSPKSTASSNTDYSNDGFGHVRKGSAEKLMESKKESQSKPPAETTAAAAATTSVNDSGFSDFGDFADFSGFPSTTFPSTADVNKAADWATVKEEKKDSPSWETQDNDFFEKNSKSTSPFDSGIDDPAWNVGLPSPTGKNFDSDHPFHVSDAGGSNYLSSGFSPPKDTSLTELLEAAKSKRKDRRSLGYTRYSNRGTSSVNSAPSITSSYLRQQHNLGSTTLTSKSSHNDIKERAHAIRERMNERMNEMKTNSYSNNTYSPEKTSGDPTSVSDIINSLDAADQMKRSDRITSHRSMGDVGVVATARAAKERLRERRRREREAAAGRNSSIRHSTSNGSDSDESEGQKESWLFDQVTGAMGPAGITADLESLSGRSNRSKNSHGAKTKSSLSTNRRRTNRKTGSRRHRSDASVDSRGSRASRYSHRSTKSFLSQMSEQSRSVANDLLRLEMQLAMVGQNNNNNANTAVDGLQGVSSSAARMSSAASLGGGSRASARSSGRKSTGGISSRQSGMSSSPVVRRQRTNIVAPPGKLGIILANKADSKGTVVSGVRTSSVLVDRISPGDRIIAIDGEDVSRMTVSEITTIMSRKAEYERKLTVLTATAGASIVRTNSDLRSPKRSGSSPRAMSVGGGRDFGGGDRGFSATGSLGGYRR